MAEPAVKRSRVEKKSGLEELSPEEQLQKMCKEYERVIKKPPREDGSYQLVLKLSYRGVLARQGYLVQQSLGSGSYSKVKCVRGFKDKPQLAAVKIISREKAPRDYQCKFMPREMRIWPELRHPNIARLYEQFLDSRRVYMVLEYAPGGDVLRYIQKHGGVRECTARAWALQVLDAVRYMHVRHIAHRDLKLENLLLDARGSIKICDFGFVKRLTEEEGWSSRTYCGSRSYAAPEILLAQQYDPKAADVWAIGVILYIMVTGRMPFDETKGTKHILSTQRKLTISWARGLNISASCRHLVTTMMTFNSKDRPTVHDAIRHSWFTSFSEPSTPVPTLGQCSRDLLTLPPVRHQHHQHGADSRARNPANVIKSVSATSASSPARARH